MAWKVVNSSLALFSNFDSSRQVNASKTSTIHIHKNVNTTKNEPMNKLFTILTLLFITLSSFQKIDKERLSVQSLNCEKFKNGTFRIPPDETTPGSTLFRNGNRQTETMDGVEFSMECIVKWHGSCTYTLTPTQETLKKVPQLPKNAVLTIEIIEVKENSYVQTTSANFMDVKITKEVFKIK